MEAGRRGIDFHSGENVGVVKVFAGKKPFMKWTPGFLNCDFHCFRWASAAAGVLTLVLFLPGIFTEHNVHVKDSTQSNGKQALTTEVDFSLGHITSAKLKDKELCYKCTKFFITLKKGKKLRHQIFNIF